ncbi:MAG: protein translocase subunit SecD [Candidatus Pelagibacter sp. TMED273]|nr:MAG: protein translocase subunit SecD [Candidatus Pelagibacter sp. TMED273]|tara:strand:+ start:11606 stop:13384 length:1779 start_codon:yes stop_codon:yes gene_type:complete
MLYFRWFIFLGLTVLSIFGINPTIDYYSNYFGKDNYSNNPEKSSEIQNLKDKSLTLGLDLQGGIHMVLELDLVDLLINLVNDEYKNDFKQLKAYESILKKINSQSTSLTFIDNVFNGYDIQTLINLYSDFIPQSINTNQETEYLKNTLKEKLSTKLLSSTEIIRNRIDAMGVTEPVIQTKGNNQIVIEIAGIQDTSRAESIIKNTGKLEFKLVKDNYKAWNKKLNQLKGFKEISDNIYVFNGNTMIELGSASSSVVIPYTFVQNQFVNDVKEIFIDNKNSNYLIDSEFLWGKSNQEFDGFTQLFYLNKYVELSGSEIKNPRALQFPIEDINSGQWYISLEFEKPKDFEEITDDNRGKFLAIVLDGEVKMAPRINQKISGGKAQITGNFTKNEAKDIEAILIAGELPSKISVASKLQVDASLGSDSINNGYKSIIIALISIFIFMVMYYKGFGLLANFAMILNLLFIIAFLSNPWINATLSLPGIAGMILTVGMAIDANVIIFERIREEMSKHRNVMDIIDSSYNRAFKTILDSNLTTLISAGSLYLFGSGPIKGFAVTLSMGIICSMFTAIFVTKTIILTYLKFKRVQKITI